MKILIVYSTRGGVSRTCAEMLANRLSGSHRVTLCSVKEPLPSPDNFDVAVLGGSVYFGAWNRTLKRYLQCYRHILSDMPCALFFCCGYSLRYEEYAELEVPKGLHCSLGIHYFGGEIKPEKRKGLEKLILHGVRQSILTQDFESPDDRVQHSLPEILPESIARLADAIRNLQ
ncbi:MAG: hypothetical protein IJY42_00525 [Clostridia bacterium]|nr:hypothetical protein [Clostridia bacterium]